MKLMKRIKDILFDEEEVEIPVIEKHTEQKMIEPDFDQTDEIKEIKLPEVEKEEEKKEEFSFPFPIEFDEDELEKTKPVEQINRYEDVKLKEPIYPKHEQEKPRDTRDIRDYSSYLREKEEKKHFKPTPIISPVYGVLDQNYKKEDLVVKITNRKPSNNKKLDLDEIRKKAYGVKEKEEVIEPIVEPKEELEVIDLEEDLFIDKNKTIGELIEEESIETPKLDTVIEEEPTIELNDLIDKKDDIQSKLEQTEELEEEDTDLFSLIDSMYQDNEE